MTLTNEELLKMEECQKLAKTTEKSQQISNFVKWLETTKGLHIARFQTNEEIEYNGFADDLQGFLMVQDYTPLGTLLAEYFQVDLKRVEDERSAMLQHIKDKTAANVQEMQNIAFSLGKNHREIF